jgi:hypothetical protein
MVKTINLKEMQEAVNSRQLKESKQPEQQPRNEEAEWNLWEIMTKCFPYQWTSREGDEPTEIWGQLLTGLTQDQINQGTKKLLKWTKEFPPTVLQFRQLCLPETISPNGGNSDAYLMISDPKHPSYQAKQIESSQYKSRRKEVARSALDDMKGMFPDVDNTPAKKLTNAEVLELIEQEKRDANK